MRRHRLAVLFALAAVVATLVVPAAAGAIDEPLTPMAVGDASTLTSVSPSRVLDTRSGVGGVTGAVASGNTIDVQVAGVGGVAAQATSVVLNVTAVAPTAQGYLTVFPTGSARPDSSNVNFSPGTTVPNLVVARVGTGGKVSIYNFGGRVDVLVDVTGYFTAGTTAGRFIPEIPVRLFDTRNSARRDGTIAPIGPGSLLSVIVDPDPPATTHIVAALLNVTVTNPTTGGYVTVFPTGEQLPGSSNLNFTAGRTVANGVIVKVGTTSDNQSAISFFNASGNTDVIVDLVGVFDDGTTPAGAQVVAAFRPLDQPVRAYDTRTGPGPFAAKETRSIPVAGFGGAPAGAITAITNLTVTATTSTGYLSTWPAGLTQPTVSSLNWAAGGTVANFGGVAVPTGGALAGRMNVYNEAGAADVIVDVTGYFYPLV